MRKTCSLILLICTSILTYSQGYVKMQEKAAEAFDKYEFQNAVTYAGDALLLAEIEVGKKSIEYANLLNELGIYKYYNYQFEEGIQNVEDACFIKKELLGEEDKEYLISFSDLGSLYYMNGENLRAEQVFIVTVSGQRKVNGGSTDLAYELNKLGLAQTNLGNFSQAEKNLKECRRLFEKNGMSNSAEFASILNNLANLYHSEADYLNAEEYYLESIKLFGKTGGKYSYNYAQGNQNLANLYGEMGRYEDGLKLIKESYDIFKSLLGEESLEFAKCLNDIAYFEHHLGNYVLSEDTYRECLELKKKLSGTDTDTYNKTRNNLAVLYLNYGNTSAAQNELEDLVQKARINKSSDPFSFNTYAQNLIILYFQINEVEKASKLQAEVMEIFVNTDQLNSHEYAMLLNNAAEIERRKENFQGSIDYLIRARKVLSELGHEESIDYLILEYQIGITQLELNRIESAIKTLEHVLDQAEKRINKKNDLYLNTLINLGEAKRKFNQALAAKPLYSEAMDIYSKILREDFIFMSTSEKSAFYNKIRLHHAMYNSFALELSKTDPRIWNDMFNYNIQFKNINLNSTRHQKELIASTRNTAMISKYDEWKSNREYLNKLYQIPKEELSASGVNLDSIERKTLDIEKELYSAERKLNNNRKVDLKMIQESLEEGQVAIEMIRVPHYGGEAEKIEVDYVALIAFPKGKGGLKAVVMKDGEKLDNEVSDLFFENIFEKKTDEHSYHLFWKEIADEIEGYPTVFLSRSGIFNIINVNTLKIFGSDEYVVDKWDIHYVRSTARLYEKKYPQVKYEEIACTGDRIHLFGYPNYYLGEATDLIASSDNQSKPNSTGRQIDADLMFISELPGTKEEVESIAEILTSKGMQPKVYLDKEATETNIKALQSPCILHLATHGFFEFDAPQPEPQSNLSRSMTLSRPLLRSGIMMAGSAYSLNLVKDNIPFLEEFEDGVLNGFEASNLDLEKTHLVVLSACLTSIGDAKINDNEGYFGMLGAFLSAGARNVIASNWAVDDMATKELMISFYTHWEQDQDVHEAFRKAQIETKEKYPEPYYWGAFILVE